MNEELELYKLVMDSESVVFNFGWIDEKSFCIWIPHFLLQKFVEQMKEIFGSSLFNDGGFDARIREEDVCINLSEVLGHRVDIAGMFEEYR